MNKPTSAVLGGAAGVAVLSVALLLIEVETRSRIGLFDVVARFVGVPGNQALGFLLFVAAGTFAWPLLFVALEAYLPLGPDPAIRGVGFAIPLWVAFVVLGRGDLSGAILVVYGVLTLFAHVAYGFTLGAVYGRLSGETDARRPMPAYPEEDRDVETGAGSEDR
ncbi:DUF6789 family protein [Halorarum salinum]|uniref:DUF6789 family protein n=1 Tax=Halorarum salinum TaxID=2743089 RepID=UPI001C52A573|nr:DUF6789 family protein [Halobaculum salinum]